MTVDTQKLRELLESHVQFFGEGYSYNPREWHEETTPPVVFALLDEIDRLRAELQARQWISVDERLPDNDDLVLVTGPGFQRQHFSFDCWRMQREAPLSWSSATIETGMAWDGMTTNTRKSLIG